MIHTTIKAFLFLMIAILLMGCPISDAPEFPVGTVEGYKPVYANDAQSRIQFETARAMKQPGKIYSYKKYLLVNERFEGIHVFDNTDKSAPKALGFLRVYGNVDMAIKNDVLYVDHVGDLVALRITSFNNVEEISRISSWRNDLPPQEGRYFECVDASRGEVIGWVLVTLKDPKCFK